MSLDQTATISLLARMLADSPKLTDAACAGRSELFDPPAIDEDIEDATYRLAAASRICLGCPALAACRDWVDSLTHRQRPAGVIAGRRPQLPAAPGRPKKEKIA